MIDITMEDEKKTEEVNIDNPEKIVNPNYPISSSKSIHFDLIENKEGKYAFSNYPVNESTSILYGNYLQQFVLKSIYDNNEMIAKIHNIIILSDSDKTEIINIILSCNAHTIMKANIIKSLLRKYVKSFKYCVLFNKSYHSAYIQYFSGVPFDIDFNANIPIFVYDISKGEKILEDGYNVLYGFNNDFPELVPSDKGE